MYDELVKMLRVCGDSNNSCANCPVRENDGSCPHGEWEFAAEKYMLQAADAIEELSKPRWIPVSERLPEKYVNVLVWIRSIGRDSFYYSIDHLMEDGQWWKAANSWKHEVTHWMPLPEPPKEGEI